MLGQTNRRAVREGVGPGAETALATLGNHSRFNLLHDGREVTLFSLEVDPEGTRETKQRRRQTGFNEDAAVFNNLTDQRFGVRVVGRVEAGVLAIFLDPLRHVFQQELLGTHHTNVAQRIGGGFEDELDAQILTGLLEHHAATGQGLKTHVAREGNMHEGLGAQLLGGPDHAITGRDEVVTHGEVSDFADHQRIFLGNAAQQENVRTHFTNTTETFRCTRNRLIHDDRFHQRIIGQRHDLRNGGLLFGSKVVRIGQVLNHPAILDVAILLDHGFSTANFVFALIYRTRNDTHVILGRSLHHRRRNRSTDY